jgi:hypothetical protein
MLEITQAEIEGSSFSGLFTLVELGICQLNFRQNVVLGCRLYHRDGVGRPKSIFQCLLESRLQSPPFGFLCSLSRLDLFGVECHASSPIVKPEFGGSDPGCVIIAAIVSLPRI